MNWDQYFMSLVYFVAMKSKDASSKAGAIIVGPDKEIRSTGFNGFPRGVNDDVIERHDRPAKYMYFEHAERNAIFNAARMGIETKGCVLYTNGTPCADCARAMIQSGIIKVVVSAIWEGSDDRTKWVESGKYSREMLNEVGIELATYDGPYITTISALRGGKKLELPEQI